MASEGVTRTQFLRIGYLAKQVGLKDEYENLNLVCSKFVHPTAWSLFAFDELPSKLPASGEILFAYGAKYLATVHGDQTAREKVRLSPQGVVIFPGFLVSLVVKCTSETIRSSQA